MRCFNKDFEKLDVSNLKILQKINERVYKANYCNRIIGVKFYKNIDHLDRDYNIFNHINYGKTPIIIDRLIRTNAFVLFMTWKNGKSASQVLPFVNPHEKLYTIKAMGYTIGEFQIAFSKNPIKNGICEFLHRPEYDKKSDFTEILAYHLEKWFARLYIYLKKHQENVMLYEKSLFSSLANLGVQNKNSVLHADYIFRNILILPHKLDVSAMIDFEHAMWGDPQYDLAKMCTFELYKDEEQKKFITGWEEATNLKLDEEKHNIYKRINIVALCQWLLKNNKIDVSSAISLLSRLR